MRIVVFGLGMLLGLCPFTTAAGSEVVFDGHTSSLSVGRSCEILRDERASMTWKQAMLSKAYQPSDQNVPNLGISSSAYWLKFTVRNTSADDRMFLTVDHPEIDELDLYLVFPQRMVVLAKAGQARPPHAAPGSPKEYAFNLDIPTSTSATILLRARSNKQLQIPLHLTSVQEFHLVRALKYLAVGGYVGIMLVLALYNLFVFFSTRDASYLIYVLYILCITLAQLTFFGIGQFYLWPELTWWSQRASVMLTLLSALAASTFMRSFINTRSYAPGLDKWLPAWYGFLSLTAVVYAFVDPLLGYQLDQVATGAFATYMFATAMASYRNGSRPAVFFLLAWSMFLVGVVLYVMKDADLLPYTTMSVYTMPIGSALEGILLSFGLADRINILRREKEQSQEQALAISIENERIIREQNVLLEEKVEQRTHDLRESNEHLKRTQTQLVNAEKMASLGQLTAGIAHEINNPINFITSNIQPLRRNITEIVEVMQEYRAMRPEEAGEKLRQLKERERQLGIGESIDELDDIIGSISEGSKRTAEIVRGLRNFSRLDEDDLKESDLREGINSTLALLAPQFRDKVEIKAELGDLPLVECFPGKINQVLMNLLTNAIQASLARTDGITPKVEVTVGFEDHTVQVVIADNGIGMSAETQARMFDPFFTTKPVGEGTGLGLAIVYGIIQDHHGDIQVDSVLGEGTSVRISLPIRHTQDNKQRA
ncbi:MAG TPA: 7TM diverse intracellular signaling domain-containing protein [Flavobacteriales bacterium]|nr:7TM diverse intracellular signaling domain-containing protein [Flavobacteriales bacterium]